MEIIRCRIAAGTKREELDLGKNRTRLETMGYSAEPVYNVFFAIEEIVKNIQKYSRNDTAISLVVNLYEESIRINIRNSGDEFDPLYMRNPDIKISDKDREIAALGIQIVRNISVSAKYIRFKGYNITSILLDTPMPPQALSGLKSKDTDQQEISTTSDEQ